jgi:hypothetical protein
MGRWTPPWAHRHFGIIEIAETTIPLIVWSYATKGADETYEAVNRILDSFGSYVSGTPARQTVNVGPALRAQFGWPQTPTNKSTRYTFSVVLPGGGKSEKMVSRILELNRPGLVYVDYYRKA